MISENHSLDDDEFKLDHISFNHHYLALSLDIVKPGLKIHKIHISCYLRNSSDYPLFYLDFRKMLFMCRYKKELCPALGI